MTDAERIAAWLGWHWDWINGEDAIKGWLTPDGKQTHVHGFSQLDCCAIFERAIRGKGLADQYVDALLRQDQPSSVSPFERMVFLTATQRVKACIYVLDQATL